MEPTAHLDSRYRDRQVIIAQGCLTNSKHADRFVNGVYPSHVVRGRGAFVYDEHGNEYLDFINGLGTNLIGYGNFHIVDEIMKVASSGINLSLPTNVEFEAAEEILTILPAYERVKFLKTGTEACLAAVKIARANTGRKRVISTGYHGWGDIFISPMEGATGCGNDQIERFLSLSQLDNTIAAVIVEPVTTDWEDGVFLRKLQERCREFGIVLIFDEIITALRVPKFTVARHFNLNPDLIIMGKALGGGLPLSCIVGKKELMDSNYFVSGTFYGEMISLCVCKKIIRLLKTSHYKIEDLWSFGEDLLEYLKSLFGDRFNIRGYPSRYQLSHDENPISEVNLALFMQECCKSGILIGPSPFISFAHISQSDFIYSSLKDIKTKLDSGQVKLEGSLPSSPYSGKVRR